MINIIIFFSLLLKAYEVEAFLEKNIAKFTSKPLYSRVEYINLSEKKQNIRIRINFKNSQSKKLKAIVIRYSLKILFEKDSNRFETISLISSFVREGEIEPYGSKTFYIYGIKNIFTEISKFRKIGYKPIFLKVELMKEPKKDEEIFMKDFLFEIKEDL
ncbi:MAG: hypothetical protein N2446_03030 [Elusimicrobiales bacterium]|nr:hypothetical protein [Elusimicrobiales bacterium]